MSIIKEEPVRFWSAITGVIVAVFAALVGFEVVSWSPDQVGLILAVLAAIGVLFQFFFVRNEVTPMAAPKTDDGVALVPDTLP